MKKYRNVLTAAVLAVLLVIQTVLFAGCGSEAAEQADTSAGVAYIQAQEARDPAEIVQVRKQQREKEIQEQCAERIEELENGGISVWSQFQDYVLLGDSRVTGFYLYGYLPEQFVIAQNGATLYHLEEHIPDIIDIDPSNIFISYGINDIASGLWNTPESYVEEYSSLIEEIHESLPDARFYIGYILPSYNSDFMQSPEGHTIDEYNVALEEMCSEYSYCYFVDCADIAEEHKDTWYDDGNHFDSTFYPYWATNMIMTEYVSEMHVDDDEEAD